MKQFLILGVFSLIIVSCSSGQKQETKIEPVKTDSSQTPSKEFARDPKNYLTDCKSLFIEARKMDSILLKQMDTDVKLGNKAIKAFTDYAYYCQSDSLSPVFLIKSGMVARSINNAPQAKIVLEKCIQDYPKFKELPAAIFLLAQLYDEEVYLNNEEEARRLYQKIIDEYPKSDYALTAKGALKFIGKSDAELAKELKKKK